MKLGINFRESSTIRGAVWVVGGVVAISLLIFGSQDKALTAISIAASVAGGIGMITKDSADGR